MSMAQAQSASAAAAGTAAVPRPSSLALVARLLTAVAIIGALIGAGFVALDWEPRLLPIRVVTVDGEMHGLSRESLQQTIAAHIDGGILTQDLAALQQRVEDLPWIRRASVRRVWPDRLVFSVSEHEAMAQWGDNGLVTKDGVVFRPRDGRLPAGLVRLDGAEDLAPEVVERYRRWHPKLAELGLIIDSVVRNARGDWTLTLLGGTELYLGTDDIETRFGRLLAAYPQVEAIGIPIRIDLRYSNGFAVRWVPRADARPERVAANTFPERS
ncbi:MAG: cell division protein FtsQ/DivIB [Thiohalocapsa sp.]|jgi:cell division protein FtsQ